MPERSTLPSDRAPFTPRSAAAGWTAPGDAAAGAGGIPVGALLAVLRRRWRIVGAVVLVSVAASALLASRERAVYRATAVIRLADARRVITTGIATPDEQQERLTSPLLSQIQLLRSRTVVGAVVDTVGLRLRPDFDGFRPQLLRDAWVAPDAPTDTLHLRFRAGSVVVRGRRQTARARYGDTLALAGVRFVVIGRPAAEASQWPVISREKAIDLLLANLKVKPRVQTNVVDVTFAARRPATAQRVVNAVVTEFQAANARSARQQSRVRRRFLEEQLRQTDSIFSRAQLALSDFRRRARVYSSRDKLAGQQRDLMHVEAQRQELEAEQRMYGALLARLVAAPEGERRALLGTIVALPGAGGGAALVELHAELERHQRAFDSLTTGPWRRAESHPDVVRLRELVTGLEGRMVGTVREHLASLDARIGSATELAERSAARLQLLPEVEAEEVRLAQRVETLRKLGDTLRDEYQRARMAEAVEVGQVEIVDLASLPYVQDAAMRSLKLVLGSVLGLLLGGAVALLLHLRDTSIRRRAELEDALHVPSLALIPRSAPAAPAFTGTARFGAIFRPRGHRAAGRADAGDAPGLVTLTGSSLNSQEAFRVLCTNLLFSRVDAPLRTLVVTSAGPREGKTVTVANLGVTFARSGTRVLLVDGDLRRGRLHRLFGVSRGPGLAQLLHDSTLAPLAIRPTEVEGLYLLTCGTARHADVDDLLRGSRMRDLLRALASKVDLVLVDAPPVLAVADASLLAAIADGVLLVVRAGQTHRAAAQDALQQLATVGARPVGAVLNDASEDAVPYPQYYSTYAHTVHG